ncbi:SNF2 family helicase [Niabella sp. CC-SYL272]|uniref:DEAD/DEAH box helicase n=1 Tax=Niabella agricola TaxID=2891571 RepID=UPI001F4021F0|nr:DEAD/DEAH box helicase [Niabella agricola]MCF3110717.1 SNF2 family helicase [Niabella agricola]
MALPHLLKHVYTFGTDEVIRRGKKTFALGFVELIEYDKLTGSIYFRVKDDSYSTFYKVHIQKFNDPKNLALKCNCPYNLGDVCKHEVAALFQLQELMDKGQLEDEEVYYDQRHTVVKIRNLDIRSIRHLCAPETFNEAEKFLQKKKAKIVYAQDETVRAVVTLDGKEYKVAIKKNEERNFDTSCDYEDTDHPLCLPKVIVFLQLIKQHGAFYFDTIRNRDVEKNKLLEAYGYSLNDDLKGKFEFVFKDGKPFLRVLDPKIKRINTLSTAEKPAASAIKQQAQTVEKEESIAVEEQPARKLGIVFDFNKTAYPYFQVHVVSGELNENGTGFAGKAAALDISHFIDTVDFSEEDISLLNTVRKLQDTEINKYVNRNTPFNNLWEQEETEPAIEMNTETRQLVNEYMLPRLRKLLADAGEEGLAFILPQGKSFITGHLEQIDIFTEPAVTEFFVDKEDDERFSCDCLVRLRGMVHGVEQNESPCPLLFLYNHQLFLFSNAESISLIEKFLPAGKMIIAPDQWAETLHEFILPLAREYKVDFDASMLHVMKNIVPEAKLLLIEKGDHLIFKPQFSYKGYETDLLGKEIFLIPEGDKILSIHRNKEKENAFVDRLKNLHSNLVMNEENGTLSLKGTEILKDNWFFLFVDAMKEMQVPVFGYDALRNFRFNTAKPQTKIFISSNTDWFDAKVDIVFGDQQVSIADVKRALANKQMYVQLGDGTLGVLPEEWLKKYALLFRVGEGANNNLKLSKYHKSVVDELFELKNEEELVFELEEKYNRLRDFEKIHEIEPPAHLQPILRPYQEAGFQWINYLKNVNWGGILADDMGLGKTVQALSYLEHHKSQNPEARILVICPTTLIYNWENEIKKFTPSLTYRIHHGPSRTRNAEDILKQDVTITTYGTLRSDIKLFVGVPFDYAVLDESQAIKNPSSKVTKAAYLINAKHRLCMSGTPLQNNTFDIYAQMNFLNPGMLGSIEFFRQEFAIPIDKLGEADRKEHLRKLLYPFILRRTKEQVAKDLPEKQEMILWCEMESEQRSIYDAYRNDYRDKILGNIESQGIGRSQMTILQGLMKLRQICDSPAILNEEEAFENHSIKIEELVREITENMSDHKALIFSQFLGMLGLIRQKLEALGIKYEYFDGSTSAPDREKAIQSFQKNEEVRVFLISLKAGGVGLNLTAADYVYIVDPWWNPAVEQQAIDRTHRIGQTKSIFAYRMICKDTIEDKILKLQEKKKALAKDLIADEAGFVKSLTKEDVEYLFS